MRRLSGEGVSSQYAAQDLIMGLRPISRALDLPECVVRQIARSRNGPFFRVGSKVCTSKDRLRSWAKAHPEIVDQLSGTLYTTRAIANHLRVSVRQVERFIAEDGLPAERKDGIVQVSKVALSGWVERRQVGFRKGP